MTTPDPYALSAEFYDVMARPHWTALGPLVADALKAAPPSAAPVLDVGAGTGLSTAVIAAALPGAEIVAVEPSPAMRAALTSRILTDAALAARVTVLPCPLDDADLPGKLGAVVACGVIGYLSPPDRHAFWKLLADRLAPGAPAVVDVMPLAAPASVQPMRIAEQAVGAHRYEVWIAGEPDGEIQHWTMTHRVLRGEDVLREVRAEHDWRPFGLDRIAGEAAALGLGCRRVTDQVAVLTAGAA